MGRKLDALLGRKFKTSKLKLTLNVAISRLSVLKNQRHARFSIARSDVIQLLHLNHHEQALLQVDQVVKDQNMFDVYVMIEGYCHLLKQSVTLIEQQRGYLNYAFSGTFRRDCPDDMEEAASSLLYAAPRCGEFPELQEIRGILTARFGKDFAYGAIELRNNSGISQEMIEKLSSRQSSLESRKTMLREIATENGIVLQLEEPSPEIRKEKLVVGEKPNQPKVEDDLMVLPREVEEVSSLSELMKGQRKYMDVTDAAQAAFESAAHAAAAARAAVELSRLDSFNSDNQDSPSSQPRKVLSSESMKLKLRIDDYKSSSYMEYEKSNSTPKYDSESEGINEENDSDSSDSDDYSEEGNLGPFRASQNPYDGSDAKQGPFGNEILYSANDYSISEGRNRNAHSPSHKQFPFRHQANPKAESGPGNPDSRFGERSRMRGVQQLNLEKRPISVRVRRVSQS